MIQRGLASAGPRSYEGKIKERVFRLKDGSGNVKDREPGDEVEVNKEIGKAMIDSGQAEEVKTRKAAKAKTGPEETRG